MTGNMRWPPAGNVVGRGRGLVVGTGRSAAHGVDPSISPIHAGRAAILLLMPTRYTFRSSITVTVARHPAAAPCQLGRQYWPSTSQIEPGHRGLRGAVKGPALTPPARLGSSRHWFGQPSLRRLRLGTQAEHAHAGGSAAFARGGIQRRGQRAISTLFTRPAHKQRCRSTETSGSCRRNKQQRPRIPR